MRRRLTVLLAISTLVAAIAAVASAHATTTTARPTALVFAFVGTPQMIVDPRPRDDPLALPDAAGNAFVPPSKVTLRIPAGYPIANGPVGTEAGDVEALVFDSGSPDGPSAEIGLYGPVVAIDPTLYPADSAASACDPRPHTGVWLASLTTLGLDLNMPIFVDAGAGPDEAEELVFCAPVPKTSAGVPTRSAPVAFAAIAFESLLGRPPSSRLYTFSAEIVPLDAELQTPMPSRAYEVRSLLPVTLTLTGPTTAKGYDVTLHGRLTVGGRPLQGDVTVYNFSPHDAADGSFDAQTDKAGRFHVVVPITRTTRFHADAGYSGVISCRGASSSPRGCLSTSLPSSPEVSWTVHVRS